MGKGAEGAIDKGRGTDGPSLPLRYIAAVGAGNALGFYDFLVFSYFSVQIGRTIFPPSDSGQGLLMTLATFAAGFAARPVGAIILGRLGDRIGRKPAMMVSLTVTGIAVAAQAFVPSYAAIGIAAPILMVALRLLVGFGLGGEVGPSTAFLVEAAPVKRRGLYVAVQYATQDLSVLASGIVGFILAAAMTDATLDMWGWRIAFLIGAAAVPLALLIRARLPETLEGEEREPSPAIAHHQTTGSERLFLILAFVNLAMGSVSAYSVGYMTTYAQNTLHMPTDIAFSATIAVGLAAVIFDLIGGWLSDTYGRKPVMFGTGIIFVVAILPAFAYLEANRTLDALTAVSFVLSACASLVGGPALVAITETFPKVRRSAGLAIVYALGISMFGGTTQFVVTWILQVTGNPLAPAYYLFASQIIWLVVVAMMVESAPGHARLKPQPAA